MAKISEPDVALSGDEVEFLDDLFADSIRNAPALPSELRARMATDALDAMPGLAPIIPPVVPQPSSGWLARIVASLGGWTAMGGLTTALVVGFGIGIAPPDAMETFATDLLGGTAAEQIEDVLWSFDSSLLEG